MRHNIERCIQYMIASILHSGAFIHDVMNSRNWFREILPKTKRPDWRYAPPLEFIQYPGETVGFSELFQEWSACRRKQQMKKTTERANEGTRMDAPEVPDSPSVVLARYSCVAAELSELLFVERDDFFAFLDQVQSDTQTKRLIAASTCTRAYGA